MEAYTQVSLQINNGLFIGFRMAAQVLGNDKGSEYVALNCYEGIRTQDEIVEEALKRLVVNAENMLVAAKELSNVTLPIFKKTSF